MFSVVDTQLAAQTEGFLFLASSLNVNHDRGLDVKAGWLTPRLLH